MGNVRSRPEQGRNAEGLERIWENVISGMLEWGMQHPKVIFREIEAEVGERLAMMRARMLADAAMASRSEDWITGEKGDVAVAN